jgi:UDP-glucuronate 4-epimerase
MTVLLTGAAGFIGHHLAEALLARGETVVGIDNLVPYYDVALKRARLKRLEGRPGFSFIEADISNPETVEAVFAAHAGAEHVVHLAAQPGVRYSLENPYAYVTANVMGQTVLLEAAKRLKNLRHFVYASSSSVYGANTDMPFSVEDRVDHPVSLYAATKRSCELIAETYAHLFSLPLTGLRFFTVYGPWGRPDMAYWQFTENILAGKPIRVFNNGDMRRDFTWIGDIIAGILGVMDAPGAGHRVYNLGNHRSEKLLDFIAEIETAAGRKAEMVFEPMQPGDVHETYADIEASRRDFGFEPTTPISEGIPQFVEWFKTWRGL